MFEGIGFCLGWGKCLRTIAFEEKQDLEYQLNLTEWKWSDRILSHELFTGAIFDIMAMVTKSVYSRKLYDEIIIMIAVQSSNGIMFSILEYWQYCVSITQYNIYCKLAKTFWAILLFGGSNVIWLKISSSVNFLRMKFYRDDVIMKGI